MKNTVFNTDVSITDNLSVVDEGGLISSQYTTDTIFNAKIALVFTTGNNSGRSGQVTGSGSMKYILGS